MQTLAPLFIATLLAVIPPAAQAQFHPDIPKAWDEEALQAMTTPLAGLKTPIKYAPADWYYRIPERVIYRGYPVYVPNKEPRDYLNFLNAQEPEIVFDTAKMSTESDWLRAGESVFASGEAFDLLTADDLHDPALWGKFQFRADAEGSLPGWRYVIRKRGKVELAMTLCGGCHEREIGGRTVPGAPATALVDAISAFAMHRRLRAAKNWDAEAKRIVDFQVSLFTAPWLQPDPAEMLRKMTAPQILALYEVQQSGDEARAGTSPFFPPKIPDLIGVKDRKYLGATGSHHNSGIADLMRYAILETGIDRYSQYGDVRPSRDLPDPARLTRLSDAQLYALALYIYSLKPPPNPNRPDKVSKRGQQIFEREGCGGCHPAPFYTDNKLVEAGVIGTDGRLALQTRRATGYYRVPSLKGVWYREPLEHNGSLATLADWFDPVRLRDKYLDKGPVKGHPFGLKLSFEERDALIAFLNLN